MVLSLTDFVTLSEPLSRDLLYLRGQREALVEELKRWFSQPWADTKLEQIASWENPHSAYSYMRQAFGKDGMLTVYGEELETLWKVSARIERERCGFTVWEHELKEA